MSDNSPNGPAIGQRRGSITQAALSNLFQRGPSTASTGPPFTTANGNDAQKRRLSITTIGLSGGSPSNNTSFMRRGSMSTNSDSIDENAIEDEDVPLGGARTAPTTPFVRHMSFGTGPAMRGFRQSGSSPGNGNAPKSPPPPSSLGHGYSVRREQRLPSLSQSHPQNHLTISAAWPVAGRRASLHLPMSSLPQASNTNHPRVSSDNPPSRADQSGFNWSEQLRSRAESSVTGARPSFSYPSGTGSNSPPRAGVSHDRARSVSEMPQPPAQASSVRPKQQGRPKPDAFQERILKGDFYMD